MDHFDLVVHDDASTDRTVEIARSFRDPRIRVCVNQHNTGIARNANAAVESAVGEFVVRLDADDELHPEHLAKCVAKIAEDDRLAFVFPRGFRMVNEQVDGLVCRWDTDRRVSGRDFIRTVLESGNPCTASGVIFRRASFYAAGGFCHKYLASPFYNDLSLWLRMACYGEVHYIAQPLVYWYDREEGFGARMRRNLTERDGFRYMAQEVEEACGVAVARGVFTERDVPMLRRLLSNYWVSAADMCAYASAQRNYCLGKAWEWSKVTTLTSWHLARLIGKLILGPSLGAGLARMREKRRLGRAL